MRRVSRPLMVVAASLTLVHCTSPAEDVRPDPEVLRTHVEEIRTAGRLRLGDCEIASTRVLPELYRRRGDTPLWTDPDVVADLLRAIAEAEEDGLDPADYHSVGLDRLERELESSARPDPTLLAERDVVMTDALLRLVYHLYRGKVDPEDLDANWNLARQVASEDPVAAVQEAIGSGELYERIQDLRPPRPSYARLRRALADLRKAQAQGGWPALPEGDSLEVGSEDARVATVRQILTRTGDLGGPPEDAGLVYDETLRAAVERFQARHGLPATGGLGPMTAAEMNVPVESRIDQVKVNMERARWILRGVPPRVVAVNIAAFEVYYYEKGELAWTTRAQVGRAYRKTPVFESEITHLVLNPTWTVPPGILAADILPAVRKDPSALEKKGLEVFDLEGSPVDPATVAWDTHTAAGLPYRLRQPAGPRNALGQVKFMFPNDHAVFLHDTPSRGLYERNSRTFSSGCVRVEAPLRLAELLLDDPAKWPMDEIQSVVATGKTTTVRLKPPVPVAILYWTAQVDPDGRLVFRPDVYERDGPILERLKGPFVGPKRAGTTPVGSSELPH